MSINAEMVDTIDALNDACGPIDKDINLEESTGRGNLKTCFMKLIENCI